MLEPQHSRFSYDHLFLPPNLPAVDHDESGADALLKEIVQAANDFYRSYPQYSEERLIWDNLARSIQKWIDLYSEGTTCSFKIIETLKALGQNGKSPTSSLLGAYLGARCPYVLREVSKRRYRAP